MGRILIVGDVHGCIEELDHLLARMRVKDGDRVVFVGDLVAKGPRSQAVVARARELGAVTVRGNHEEHVLAYRRAVAAGEPPPKIGRSHREVVESLTDEDWAYLEAMPLHVAIPEHGAIVVHAGLAPGVPLEAQAPEHMMNMRSIRPDGTISTRLEEGVPWGARWTGPERVFFGHDAVRGLQLHPYAIGLDTGCVYGGELTAMELPGMRLHSVPAVRVHCEPIGRRKLRHIPLGRPDELPPHHVVTVDLGRDDRGRPVEALVVRAPDGEPRAYRNLCQHIPVPLDGGSRSFLTDDGKHFRCGTHGALYRIEDGYCESGPCLGSYLRPLRLRREGEELVLLLDETSWD